MRRQKNNCAYYHLKTLLTSTPGCEKRNFQFTVSALCLCQSIPLNIVVHCDLTYISLCVSQFIYLICMYLCQHNAPPPTLDRPLATHCFILLSMQAQCPACNGWPQSQATVSLHCRFCSLLSHITFSRLFMLLLVIPWPRHLVYCACPHPRIL